MIDRIVIEHFKSLFKVDLSLGHVNLFIGTNASGKSNFLEALRFLEGVGNGFTVNEILNGKPKGATSEVWDGIRGGSAHACFGSVEAEVAITAHGTVTECLPIDWAPFPSDWIYRIAFLPSVKGIVTQEEVQIGGGSFGFASMEPSPRLPHIVTDRGYAGLVGIPSSQSIDDATENVHESQISPEDPRYVLLPQAHVCSSVAKLFSGTQRLELSPQVLRNYSKFTSAQRMGNHGENFAALVKTICENQQAKDAYLSWLRQLRPEEIDDVGTLSGAIGEPMFMLRENGRECPAPVLSDGTLRFAAITAAFFQADMPSIITIEEIENGIHASRVKILLELLRSQAEHRDMQVMATTHSATVLDWLREEDYKTTFLCRRDESTGESKICSLTDIPHFLDAVKKKPASALFSEGWLEMAS
ncbi:MAG: AAA family ATPase [Albidovulum sp.]|nr:AAA family ATPase [Albidovulum sp.]